MTDASYIVTLRKETGASFGLCKEAAERYPDDLEKAKNYIVEETRKKAGSREGKESKNGIIEVYSHMPNKNVGCMVEVTCETDFVASNEEFHQFAKTVALQIAAMNPTYVDVESIPEEEMAKLKERWMEDVDTSKPQEVIEKILEGKLRKHLEEVSLLDQPYFKDESLKMRDLLKEITGKLGENIKITRFTRWQM
jgi:elongation factor Ts